jgi:hypothetical protein
MDRRAPAAPLGRLDGYPPSVAPAYSICTEVGRISRGSIASVAPS